MTRARTWIEPALSYILSLRIRTVHTVILISYMVAEPVLWDSRFIETTDLRRRYGNCERLWPPEPESQDAELLKDLRGLGKPPSFDGNDAEYQDFRFSFRIHMSFVSSVSHELMDRLRSRAKSDLPDSSESSGRNTLEVLHADVFCIGLDNERQSTNPDPILWGNQRSRGMATDTQSIRPRKLKIDSMPWSRRSWCLRNPGANQGLRS